MTIDDLMLALKSIVHERDEVAEYLEAALAERDALKNRVAEKCACTFANVSDGPHPELPAKSRMYATNVCWYHRSVQEERNTLQARVAELEKEYFF